MTLLIGFVIFIGLPVLAWGIGDRSEFCDHPARMAYIVLTVVMQSVVVTVMPNAGRDRRKGETTVGRQKLALLLLQILSLAVVIIAPYGDRRGFGIFTDAGFLRYFGLAMYVMGFALMHRAESHLDRQFSVQVTVQKEHRLITDGPYRLVRHPRYLGN